MAAKEKPTRILAFGALGNVGAEIVKALQASETPVRAGDLLPEKFKQRYGDSVKAVAFDFGKPVTFGPAFQGIERAFIMRPSQITDIKKYRFPAMEAARAAGVKHR